MPTIGVISDTHGLLRPEALEALAGSDLIVHAGDVGDVAILTRLSEIAPVRAVRGNTDYGELARSLPATDVVDLGRPDGRLVAEPAGPVAYVLHELEHLDLDPAASGFAVVVYGHTHRPAIDERDGVAYLNPGAAGQRRFNLPISVARIAVDSGADGLRPEIIVLDVD